MSYCCRIAGILIMVASCALADPAPTTRVRYDGYKFVRVQVREPADIERIRQLGGRPLSDAEGIGPVAYLLPPMAMDGLAELGVSYQVLQEDIQTLIDAERASLAARGDVDARDPGWFEDYKDSDQIYARLLALEADHPELCEVFSIGASIEGRNTWAMRITSPGGEKPIVVFDAAIHAREWISPMTVMWIADRLVSEYETDPTSHAILDTIEVVVIPVINPDGYAYTWDVDRMWRKNRRDIEGSDCFGVDCNRNYAVGWGGPGSSTWPCDDLYCGTGPFSEPETQNHRDFVLANPRIVSGISYHSFSQLIMSPYGYSSTLPADNDLFLAVDEAMHDEILAVHGMQYDWGPIYSTIYPASGSTVDWCYDGAGVFEFTIELRDTGAYGFLLPADQIIPTAEENWEAARYLMEWSAGPVKFSFPQGLPDYISPLAPTTLLVKIEDNYESVVSSTATLYSSVSGAAFTPTALTYLGGSLYEAQLPIAPCGTTALYYFGVQGDGGTVTFSPPAAPASTYSVGVAIVTAVLDDDFETELGWTVSNDPSLTSGAWERGDPVADAEAPAGDADGSGQCYVTGNQTGNWDVDGGPTRLTGPLLDLTTFDDPVLEYARWFGCDDTVPPSLDVLDVEISSDDGATWQLLEQVLSTPTWVSREWHLKDYVPLTEQFRLRFTVDDSPNNSVTEAGVDAVRVFDLSCPGLLGDLNCDGVVNAFDLDPFILALTDPAGYALALPDCSIDNADCNQDGVVNAFDIDPFVELLVP